MGKLIFFISETENCKTKASFSKEGARMVYFVQNKPPALYIQDCSGLGRESEIWRFVDVKYLEFEMSES